MKLHKRVKVLKAMDTIMRSLNDEELFMSWLAGGVADEDIKENTTDEELECYVGNDEDFKEIGSLFLYLMFLAATDKDKGLYCDDVSITSPEAVNAFKERDEEY